MAAVKRNKRGLGRKTGATGDVWPHHHDDRSGFENYCSEPARDEQDCSYHTVFKAAVTQWPSPSPRSCQERQVNQIDLQSTNQLHHVQRATERERCQVPSTALLTSQQPHCRPFPGQPVGRPTEAEGTSAGHSQAAPQPGK